MTRYQSPRALGARAPFYIFAGAAAIAWMICAPRTAGAELPHATVFDRGAPAVHLQIAQDDEGEDAEVPNDQVEKYVAVYRAMQRNRNLTVEKAAAMQGMTVEQFRDLENRIQRDDAAMQHARDELQASAAHAPGSSSTPR